MRSWSETPILHLVSTAIKDPILFFWTNNLRELIELAIMFNKESASIAVQRKEEKVVCPC